MYNAVSGETITYTYDSMNRYSDGVRIARCRRAAPTKQLQWAGLYGYDFRNLLAEEHHRRIGDSRVTQRPYILPTTKSIGLRPELRSNGKPIHQQRRFRLHPRL